MALKSVLLQAVLAVRQGQIGRTTGTPRSDTDDRSRVCGRFHLVPLYFRLQSSGLTGRSLRSTGPDQVPLILWGVGLRFGSRGGFGESRTVQQEVKWGRRQSSHGPNAARVHQVRSSDAGCVVKHVLDWKKHREQAIKRVSRDDQALPDVGQPSVKCSQVRHPPSIHRRSSAVKWRSSGDQAIKWPKWQNASI